jgi:hypothetical protein
MTILTLEIQMKGTFLKLGMVVGTVTIGTSAMYVAPAYAASVGTTTTNCDFSGAVVCTNVLSGNDSTSDLNAIDDSPFSTFGWQFLSKINAPNTTPDEGVPGIFSLTYVGTPSDSKSGTWSVLQSYLGNSPFVLAMKAGPKYAYNYFDGTVFSGTWDTERFLVGQSNQQAGLSHVTLYVPKNFQPVPTPALLPGLIGMGIAAWRKRKSEQAESEA